MSDAPSGPRLSFDVRSRQDQRRVVNFGVVATARVLGTTPDEHIALRCECGDPGCSRRIAVTPREYGDGGDSARLLVARGHEPTGSGRVGGLNDRFAVVIL